MQSNSSYLKTYVANPFSSENTPYTQDEADKAAKIADVKSQIAEERKNLEDLEQLELAIAKKIRDTEGVTYFFLFYPLELAAEIQFIQEQYPLLIARQEATAAQNKLIWSLEKLLATLETPLEKVPNEEVPNEEKLTAAEIIYKGLLETNNLLGIERDQLLKTINSIPAPTKEEVSTLEDRIAVITTAIEDVNAEQQKMFTIISELNKTIKSNITPVTELPESNFLPAIPIPPTPIPLTPGI